MVDKPEVSTEQGLFKQEMLNAPEQKSFPPTVEKEVSQNEYVDVIILPTDGKAYLIHTRGRIVCDASLLWAIESNGTEYVTMTHYDPSHVNEHLGVIAEKEKTHPKAQRYGILLTWGKEDDEWRKKISKAISDYAGSIDVISMPNLGVEEAKELKNPLNILKYQLSFVRGYSGDMKSHRIRVRGSDYEKTIKT